MDSNAKGCIAEYRFGIECLKRDIKVSYPLVHTSFYDCIADTGESMYRIQIKSTTQGFQKHRKTVHIQWKHNYEKIDVDYFAIRMTGQARAKYQPKDLQHSQAVCLLL